MQRHIKPPHGSPEALEEARLKKVYGDVHQGIAWVMQQEGLREISGSAVRTLHRRLLAGERPVGIAEEWVARHLWRCLGPDESGAGERIPSRPVKTD